MIRRMVARDRAVLRVSDTIGGVSPRRVSSSSTQSGWTPADKRRMKHEGGKAGSFGDGSEIVIGACIEVHRHLGPGLLESAYEQCLCHELTVLGVAYERQKLLPLVYKGVELHPGYRLDLVVRQQLLVEIKAVERLLPVHEAQVITYLRLSGLPVALLVNFHTPVIKQALRRFTNNRNLPVFPPSCDPKNC